MTAATYPASSTHAPAQEPTPSPAEAPAPTAPTAEPPPACHRVSRRRLEGGSEPWKIYGRLNTPDTDPLHVDDHDEPFLRANPDPVGETASLRTVHTSLRNSRPSQGPRGDAPPPPRRRSGIKGLAPTSKITPH